MAYRILAWFLRVVTKVFFRQIEVAGLEHVPKDGAVLFAGNHPNSLIDPILIITTCGRKVHFAAKDALFKGRIMRAVLRGKGWDGGEQSKMIFVDAAEFKLRPCP